jgi:peptide/nickel transport system permease protein
MAQLIRRRLIALVPVIIGASILIFAAGRIATPNPSTTAISILSTPEVRQQFIEERNLDEPIPAQYALWVQDVFSGDLGRSLITFEPVSETITRSLGVTLALTAGAFLLTAVLGLTLGTIAGLLPGSRGDRVITGVTMLGVSLPAFWLGLLLIEAFSIRAGLLPAGGYVPPGEDPVQFVRSMILPWVTLAIAPSCIVARVTRARVAEELGRPHVNTARALGVTPWTRISRYVLRNSLLEPTAVLGVQLGYMLGGAVIVETIFSLPGLGSAALQAADQGDFPLLQATALLAMVFFVCTSLIVDILHAALDRGVARHG